MTDTAATTTMRYESGPACPRSAPNPNRRIANGATHSQHDTAIIQRGGPSAPLPRAGDAPARTKRRGRRRMAS